jgi:hypothetical protein
MNPAQSRYKWPCAILLLACAGAAGAEAQQKPVPKPQAAPRPVPVLKRTAVPVPAPSVTDVLLNEPVHIRRGINSDAGVPPSGVPVETMHA